MVKFHSKEGGGLHKAFMNKWLKMSETTAHQILWFLIGLYVLNFSLYCYLKFISFSYDDFDLAHHCQILWSILHGTTYISILGVSFLGNHMHLISFLLAPIYKIFPHPLTLLFLQSLVLGLGAYPLFLLAKSVLGHKWALTIATLYLLYPSLGYVNLFEYHPTCFATLFLMFMLYYLHKGHFGFFTLYMTLAMICQENIPLVLITTGIYAFLMKKSFKWIFIPLSLGIGYFLLSIHVLIPFFNHNTIQFWRIYEHLGDSPLGIMKTIITQPLKIMGIMFQPHKVRFLIQLFAPLLFIPLLSPLSLFISIPLFMQHLLSSRMAETVIYYHYTAEIIPFIFFALIFGTVRILKFRHFKLRQVLLATALIAVSLIHSIKNGPHFNIIKELNDGLRRTQLDEYKENLLKAIPADASIMTTFEFLPYLANREHLYSFHHLYNGFYTLSDLPYRLPEDTEYALIDFNDQLTLDSFYRPDHFKNIQAFSPLERWGAQNVEESICLLQKNTASRVRLFNVLSEMPTYMHNTSLIIDHAIKLLGYDCQFIGDQEIHLTLFWQSLSTMEKETNIFIDFLDSAGHLIERHLQPICYRIFPTQAWQPQQLIRDDHYVILPRDFKENISSVRLGISDHLTGQIYKVSDTHPSGSIELNLANR